MGAPRYDDARQLTSSSKQRACVDSRALTVFVPVVLLTITGQLWFSSVNQLATDLWGKPTTLRLVAMALISTLAFFASLCLLRVPFSDAY